jgi:peptidoglycan/LPS O-acetylase OafA/YrhL
LEKPIISRDNNFDLLRLIAALQVVIGHVSEHLSIDLGYFGTILGYMRGVPIFFTISGFLITMSYDRNNDIRKYIRNRLLRIYPALWVCVLFTIITIIIFYDTSIKTYLSKEFFAWIFSQITMFQFFTPDILRGWGVNTPNGSLWTIPVEIQFYIFVPLVFLCFRKVPILIKLACLFLLSLGMNILFSDAASEKILIKILGVSIFPHLFNFLIGSIIYLSWGKIKNVFENKGLLWLAIFVGYSLLVKVPSYIEINSVWGIVSTMLLSITVISLAFSFKNCSKILLRGNDLSYGVYLFHMPIVNIFVNMKLEKYSFGYMLLIILITVLLAYISWTFIEKRILKLKALQRN